MSLQKKIFLALLGVISIGFIALSFFFIRHESRQHIQEEMESWQKIGDSFACAWKTTMRWTGSDNLARDQLYNMKNSHVDLNAIHLARNPKLTRINLGSSPYISTELEKHVLKNGKPYSVILPEDSSGGQLITLIPIIAENDCVSCHRKINAHSIEEGEVMGVLSLTTSLEDTYVKILDDRKKLIISFSGVFLLLALTMAWIIKTLTGPLKTISKTSYELAEGNMGARVQVASNDELGALGKSFNQMAEKLQKSRKTLEQEVTKRTRELATLNAIALCVSQSHKIENILDNALSVTMEAMQADNGSICLLNTENRLVRHTHSGLSDAFLKTMDNLPLGDELPGKVAKSGVLVTSEDMWSDSRIGIADVVRKEGIRSFTGVPLVTNNRVIGVLSLGYKKQRKLSANEMQLLTAIGQQIGVAVEDVQLFHEVSQSKKDWETTFDSISDLIWVQDCDCTIRRANKAAAEIFNMKPTSLVGKKCFEIFCRSDYHAGNCPFQKMKKTGEVESLEIENTHLKRSFYISTDPIFDAGGNVIGGVHIAKDITEEKHLREELQQSEKLAAVGELVAGVAHELNNPLTGVIGFSSLLLNEGLPPEFHEDVKSILEQGERCQKIVKNLLTFARKYKPEKSTVDINSAIQSVLDIKQYELTVSNIKIIKEFDPNLPSVLADFHQVQQIFLNLVNNAQQAMVEANGRGVLRVTTEVTGNSIRAHIVDDGPGIAPETLKKIFNPFFTTKETGRGTGLGLSICDGIIREHGGRIWVETQKGQGATFVVELPVPSENEIAAMQIQDPAVGKRNQPAITAKNILVIDDEKVVYNVMRRILERDGH
ncbi:MAG: ATP-binding protein, partial [bacterium]